jgi:hypothetical protein
MEERTVRKIRHLNESVRTNSLYLCIVIMLVVATLVISGAMLRKVETLTAQVEHMQQIIDNSQSIIIEK